MVAPVIVLLAGLRWHPIVGYGMIVMLGRHRRGGMTILSMLNRERVVRGVVRQLGLSGQRGHNEQAHDQGGDNASPSVKHVPSYSHVILLSASTLASIIGHVLQLSINCSEL